MNRAGGWILGLLAVGGILGGGGFTLRRAMHREPAAVHLVHGGKDPTHRALLRGAEAALRETGNRAGRFRVSLGEVENGDPDIADFDVFDGPGRFLQVSAFEVRPGTSGRCVTPPCRRQGEAAAAWARKAKAARIALLHDKDNPRSEAIASAFGAEARRLGLQVDGPLDAVDTRVDAILASRPDLVFYAGEASPYTTTFRVFSALRAGGFTGPLATGEADPEVSFLATRPDLVEGTYLVSPFAPAPADVAARMGFTPGPHVTAGYYAMKAVLEAIDRADTLEPEALRSAASGLPAFTSAPRPCALYVARGGVYEFVELLD